jgi:hypothetical protein
MGAVVLTILLATEARAASGAVSLEVECPALDEGARAELEARARAELAARPEDGEVLIECYARRVRMRWKPLEAGHPPHWTTVDDGADDASTIEATLTALDALLGKLARAPGQPDGPTAANPSTASRRAEQPMELPSPRAGPRPGVTAGADAELWRGTIGVALGAHAGARLFQVDGWSATILGGLLWGLGSSEGVRARALRGEVLVEFAPTVHVRLGAGADLRLLDADAAGAQLTGSTAGALVSARYAVVAGPLALSAGPVLEGLVRPIVVQYSGREMFRVPQLLASVQIDATLGD